MKDIIADKYGKETPYIPCLDHGFVTLVDCMPRMIKDEEESADHAIAEAARCSYQRGTKTMADDKTLIRYLMRHNHSSPFEMIEFKFHCKLPIYTARQMVRTRTASLNELSGRYSEMPEEYDIPGELRVQSLTNTQGSEGGLDEETVRKLTGLMNLQLKDGFNFYHQLLEAGVAREQARIVLSLATYTEWFWKIDLHNLLHFLDLRCDGHAQKEIQVYANAILDLLKPIVPWSLEAWEDYSPYRGGMLLTRFEVEAIKDMFLAHFRSDKCEYAAEDIKVKNLLEQKEWKEKAVRLGFKS